MNRKTFEHEMHKADAMMHAEHERQHYWSGYKRGLRRRFHGEKFGTEEEHQLWMTAEGDETRRQRSQGYRDAWFHEIDHPEERIKSEFKRLIIPFTSGI